MKLKHSKPDSSKKEFKYYLTQYENDVKRHNYWRGHPVKSNQIAGMLDKSSESAKVHLNSAIIKYLMHLNFSEKSPKVRDQKLRELVSSFVTTFERNNLGVKTRGNRGKMLGKVLYESIKNGTFQDLRHNHIQKTPEELEIEVEYRDLISHYFKHEGIARDTSRILEVEFGKIGV